MALGDAPAYLVVKTLDWEYTRDGEQFKVKANLNQPANRSKCPEARQPSYLCSASRDCC